MRLKFSTETSYCLEVAEQVENFLKDVEDREKILGIGISIPGIIDQENRLVMKFQPEFSGTGIFLSGIFCK